MAKKNQKQEDKPLKKEDKKVLTVKIPSIGLKHIAVILGVLLIASLFFNFKGSVPSGANLNFALPLTAPAVRDFHFWAFLHFVNFIVPEAEFHFFSFTVL